MLHLPAAKFIDRLMQSLRGRNAILNVFELWVGLAGIISGIVFFTEPQLASADPVARAVGHTVALTWVIGYIISGSLVWYGLLRPAPRWEVAGLWLLGGTVAVNGVAIASVIGLNGVASAVLFLVLTGASWARAVFVQVAVIRLSRQYEERVADDHG